MQKALWLLLFQWNWDFSSASPWADAHKGYQLLLVANSFRSVSLIIYPACIKKNTQLRLKCVWIHIQREVRIARLD